MFLKTGLPAAAVTLAAAAVLLQGCSSPAPAGAGAGKPRLTVFRLPPGAFGAAAGPAAGRAALLAGAGAAARASEPAAGRYWVTPALAGNFVEVGTQRLHYLVLEKVATQNWADTSAGASSTSAAQPLGVQLATAGDQAAWRRAGQPAQWRTVAQDDGLTDPQGYANTGRLAPLSAVPQRPQVTRGSAGEPPFPIGGEQLSLAGLRALPADPAALKSMLMKVYNKTYGDTQAYLLQVIPPVLDMPLTPAVRSAFYLLLAGLPGLRSLGMVTDVAGRRGAGVAYSAGYSACGGVLDLGGAGAAGFQTTFPSCTVQQILVVDPATGRPLAEELRYVKLPGGSAWSAPGGLFSYEIYAAPYGTNAPAPRLVRDGQLAQQGPVVLGDRDVDDLRCLGQVRRQVLLSLLEVRGRDVRGARRVVPEGLDQHVLLRIGQAPGPVEPQAARLFPGRLGEVGGDPRPLISVLRPDPELGRDEDHQFSLASRG